MSAETLRRAAVLMRERADAAIDAWGDGGWTSGHIGWDDRNGTTYDVKAERDLVAATMVEELAEHISSWHPAVALAVAQLLEQQAAFIEKYGDFTDIEGLGDANAFALAQTYLGEVTS